VARLFVGGALEQDRYGLLLLEAVDDELLRDVPVSDELALNMDEIVTLQKPGAVRK